MQTHPVNQIKPYAFVVCGIAAAFYLYEFVLQVAPGVMAAALMRDLMVDAASLSLISAFYYYAYTPMQVVGGLLYDRFGTRIILAFATFTCALGALLSGMAFDIVVASAGRFFMGFGSSFAFVGVLVLIARWFPPKYFALLAGMTQLLGAVGAILAGGPLERVLELMPWRDTLWLLALIGFGLVFIIWFFVKEQIACNHGDKAQPTLIQDLVTVCGNSQTWLIALYAFLVWAPVLVLATLWGVSYLKMIYPDAKNAAYIVSLIWVGLGIGSPLIGWWSDKMGRRCWLLSASALLGAFSLVGIILLPMVPLWVMGILMFTFGLGASSQALSFALVKDINPENTVGTAIGFNNMAVVAGGALLIPVVGLLLKLGWEGVIVDGVPIYAVAAYQKALLLLPICYFVSFLISAFMFKETYCESKF